MIISLNNSNWTLKGWHKNQWKMVTQMETGAFSIPAAGPVKATVPGAVQADLLKAGLLDDWNYGLNSLKDEWVENREWAYECDFEIPPEANEDKYVICFDGLDHEGIVKLNNVMVLHFKGMHFRWQVDITKECKRIGKNHLRVIFFQPPEVDGQIGYTSQETQLKSRFNYTWDWCPRIVNIGIWREVYVKGWSKARITDFYPKSMVSGDKKSIDISLTLDCIERGEYTAAYVLSKNGVPILNGMFTGNLDCTANESMTYKIDNVSADLWWPNGFGEQNLYDMEISLLKDGKLLDKAKKSIGFRNIHFVSNFGASENALPYTANVNARNLFIRGLNWVPISPLYGTITREEYRKYLSIFRDMNINLLRVWGGAMLESTDFYDICDEYGILIWQEFPQSSSGLDNTPCEDKAFIEELAAVAKEYILQRRHHACHVIWCGGNELMWDNSIPVDTRSANINRLRCIVSELDGDKHFLPASPSGSTFSFNESQMGKGFNHDVHGPWDYLGDVKHYRRCNIDDSLFNSEVGCSGMPRYAMIKKYSAGMKLWPPDKTNPYYVHRGSMWIKLGQLSGMFGDFKEDGTQIIDYINASRYMQAESLGYSAQAARRAYPQRSGVIAWMGNEPFPNNSNTSVIEYDGTPKPVYYRLKSAFSPIDVSAKYDKIGWEKGEEFQAEIYAVSDDEMNGLTITADMYDIYGHKRFATEYKNCDVHNPIKLGTIVYPIEENMSDVFILRVQGRHGEKVIGSTEYHFTLNTQHSFLPILALPRIQLEVSAKDTVYRVLNKSKVAAIGVFAYMQTETGTVPVDTGYFDLLPDEEMILTPSIECNGKLMLEGMNLNADTLL